MRRIVAIAVVATVVATACTSTADDAPAPLAEQLTDTATTVNGAIAELFSTMEARYDDRSQLYTRLIDLDLPTTFAIELDKTQRVEPPAGSEAELERYLDFLGELLLASEDLDAAIAAEDPVATALAAVAFEVASGALAVVLPSSSCRTLAPTRTRDLCGIPDLTGYEDDLDFEIRRFVASFRPAFRIPDTFGNVVKARALGSLQDDATLVLQNTASRLDALDPPDLYARLHAVLLDYFPTAAEAWARFDADPTGADPLLYDFIVDSLEEIRRDALDALEREYDIIRAADDDSRIDEILDIWFDPRPIGTGE